MPGFKRVASIEEIPPGEARVFIVDGVEIAVANLDGNFYAIDDVCSHDGGPLGEGPLSGAEVECWRHGARFDVRTGQPRALPAMLPVRTYPVVVVADEIRVDVG